MPNYTLYYFNGRGRAEILRMLFSAAGVHFNDKRFEFSEWDRYRNDMPSLTVPVLEMDGGHRMPEMMSICRFLAREFGFYPRSTMDMFRCDYIADCFYEILHDYMRYYHWKNGRFRHNMMDSSMVGSGMSSSDMMSANYDNYMHWRYLNSCQRVLPFLERTLEMRNGGNQFFMGDQLLWCDMMCYCCLENPYMENPSLFSNYPKLKALRNRVAAHPKVSSYLKNRNQTTW